jgi:hypothetical protein
MWRLLAVFSFLVVATVYRALHWLAPGMLEPNDD